MPSLKCARCTTCPLNKSEEASNVTQSAGHETSFHLRFAFNRTLQRGVKRDNKWCIWRNCSEGYVVQAEAAAIVIRLYGSGARRQGLGVAADRIVHLAVLSASPCKNKSDLAGWRRLQAAAFFPRDCYKNWRFYTNSSV